VLCCWLSNKIWSRGHGMIVDINLYYIFWYTLCLSINIFNWKGLTSSSSFWPITFGIPSYKGYFVKYIFIKTSISKPKMFLFYVFLTATFLRFLLHSIIFLFSFIYNFLSLSNLIHTEFIKTSLDGKLYKRKKAPLKDIF